MTMNFKSWCCIGLVTVFSAVVSAEQPNIIVIMADDLGYADAGCYGCKDIPTPHIDSLAKQGVRFTSGYVTWPMCGPSPRAWFRPSPASPWGRARSLLWNSPSESF